MTITKRSPVALAVLVLLYEEPMHAYRMQQLIRERGKDEVINVSQRNSLYQIIGRLERDGLIAEKSTTRDRNRPERTVYEITNAGLAITIDWTREILSTPSREYPEFPAAISVLPVLTPKDALKQLEFRMIALKAELNRLEQQLSSATFVPRLFLLELEYLHAQASAELRWVEAVVDDLRSDRLTWNKRWLKRIARELGAQHDRTGKGA